MSVSEEAEDMGSNGTVVVQMNSDHSVMDIIALCDPREELISEAQFIVFWIRSRVAIELFISKHSPL
jgi:hypothetical protein